MDQREEFCRLGCVPGANIRQLCRRFAIAPAYHGFDEAEFKKAPVQRSKAPACCILKG